MPKAPLVHVLYKTAQALGPQRVQVLKLFFEQGLEPDQIKLALGISEEDYQKLTQFPAFIKEYEKQNRFFLNSSKKLKVRNQKNNAKKRNSLVSVNERLQNLAPDALDELEQEMRHSVSEPIRQRAALEILDRAGYVKVEKKIQLQLSAEEVIKELNRNAAKEDFTEAEIVETKKIDGPITGITE
jgi:septum formation topological specificity factor MinE